MAPKSAAFRLAPPTSAPSTLDTAKISTALDGFTDPPYNSRICAAFAAAAGAAVAVDGQMIDKPLHERALAILRSAGGTA